MKKTIVLFLMLFACIITGWAQATNTYYVRTAANGGGTLTLNGTTITAGTANLYTTNNSSGGNVTVATINATTDSIVIMNASTLTVSGNTAVQAINVATGGILTFSPATTTSAVYSSHNSGTNQITFTAAPSATVGQLIIGAGITSGTTITAISGSTVTLSQSFTTPSGNYFFGDRFAITNLAINGVCNGSVPSSGAPASLIVTGTLSGTTSGTSTNRIVMGDNATVNAFNGSGSNLTLLNLGANFNFNGTVTLPNLRLDNSFGASTCTYTLLSGASLTITSGLANSSTYPNRRFAPSPTSNLTINAYSAGGALGIYFASSANTINNFSITPAITLANALTVNGTLTLNGALTTGGNLTMGNGATIARNAGSLSAVPTIGTGNRINVTYGGTSTSTTTQGVELPTSTTALNNLTVNCTGGSNGGLTLNAGITVNGTLTLTQGVLTTAGNLTMANGSTISRATGTMSAAPTIGSGNSINVTYTGTSTSTTTQGVELPTSATALNNLTVNCTGGSNGGLTLNAAVTVNGTLTLTQGILTTAGNLTMANASTISRRTGTMSAAPTIGSGNSINVIYTGTSTSTTTSGNELPASATALNNLTVNCTGGSNGGLSLNANATVNGTVFLTAGILNLNSRTLTVAVNGGVSRSGGTISATPTYSGAATVTYTGSTLTTTSSELPVSNTSITLEVNNSGGVKLNRTTTIGTLTLTSGKLDLNGYNLITNTVTNSSSFSNFNTSNSNYIYNNGGSFTANVTNNNGTAAVFPIGTSTTYTPISFTSASADASITVKLGTANNFGSTASEVLPVQWYVKSSVAATSTVGYQFNSADYSNSFAIGNTNDLAVTASSVPSSIVTAGVTISGANPYSTSVASVTLPTNDNEFFIIGKQGSILSAASIAYGTLSGVSFPACATASGINLTFTSSGTFNSGNVYNAELSDANGFFNTPTIIGSLTSTANSGTIGSIAIPDGIPAGTGYRIRISSTNPNANSFSNGSDLVINAKGTWIGGVGGNANTGANWCGGLPLTNAIISSGSPTLSADLSISGNVTLSSGASIVLGSNTLTLGGSITGTGVITGSTTSNLTINGTGAFGTLYMDQTTPGTTNVLGTLTIDRTSSGSVTLAASNPLTVATALNLTNGTLNDGGNTITVNGNITGTSASASIITGSGNVRMSSTGARTIATIALGNFVNATTSATTTISGAVTIAGTTALTSGTGVQIAANGTLTFAGTLGTNPAVTFTAGPITFANNTATVAFNYNPSSNIPIGFFSSNTVQNLTINSAANVTFLAGGTNTLLVNGTLTIGGAGHLILNGAGTNSLIVNALSFTSTGRIWVQSGSATLTFANTSPVSISPASNLYLSSGTTGTFGNQITMNTNSTVTFTSALTTTKNISFTKGTLNIGTNNLTISGTNIAGTTGSITSTSGKVIMSGSSATTIVTGMSINNLDIQNSAGVSLSGSGTTTLTGSILSHNGANTAGYTLSTGNNTLAINGTISSSFPLTVTTGTNLSFSATNSVPTSINTTKLAGLTVAGGSTLTLTGNLSTTSFTLTSGKVSLGNFDLSFENALAAGSASAYVVATGSGRLIRSAISSVAGTFNFPVGDATNYTPVTLTSVAGTPSSATIAVNLVTSKHPNNTSFTDFLTRYWSITQTGISGASATVAATYINGDITGSEANISNAQRNGNASFTKSGSIASNTLTYTSATLTGGTASAFTGIETVATVNSGDVTGGGNVCSSSANSTDLSLSGYTVSGATIVKWQSSTDEFVSNVVDIANTGTTYTAANVTTTTSYRAVLSYTGQEIASGYTTISSLANGNWIGSIDNDANNPGNWCGGLPTSGTNIVIPGDGTPQLSDNLAVNNVNILGSLNLNGNTLTINGAITGSGAIIGSSTSGLTINGTGAFGSLYMSQSSAAARTLGTFTINRTSSGTVTLATPIIVGTNFNLTAGTLNDGGNSITVNGNVTGTSTTASIHSGSGSMVLGGSGARTISNISLGNINVSLSAAADTATTSGTVVVTGVTTLTSGGALKVGASSTLRFESGTSGATHTASSGLFLRASGSTTIATNGNASSTLEFKYTNTQTLSALQGLFNNANFNNLTISGAGSATFRGSSVVVVIPGSLAITGAGSFNADGSNGTVGVTLGNAPICSGAGRFNMSTGASSTLTFNNTSPITFTPSTLMATNTASFAIAGSSTVTLGSALTLTSAANLTLTSGTFNIGTFNVSLSGNIAGTSGVVTGTSGKVIMTGSTARTIATGITLNNLDIQNSAGVSLSGGGTTTLTGSTLSNNGGNTAGYGLTMSGNTLAVNGTISSAFPLTVTTSSWLSFGATNSVPTSVNATKLADLTVTSGTLTLTSNLSAGSFSLTSGKVSLGNFDLTFDNALAAGSASAYVVATGSGRLVRSAISSVGGTFNFPVGDATNYTPIAISSVTGSPTSASIAVNLVSSKHPSNTSFTDYLSRYWNVTQTGISGCTATVTATFVGGDVTGQTADISNAQKNGTSAFTKSGTLSSTTLTRTAATLTSGTVSAFTGVETTSSINVGDISGEGFICSGSNVTMTLSGNSPGGTIVRWESSLDDFATAGTPIAHTSTSYTATNVTATTTYRVVLSYGGQETVSNTATLTPLSSGSWLGTTSTDANLAANWCGGVPTSATNVTITAGTIYTPTLTGSLSLNNIVLNDNFVLNGRTLTIAGAISGTGGITGSSTSALSFTGTGSAGTLYMDQTSAATSTLSTLTINRSTNDALSLGTSITLSSAMNITSGIVNDGGNTIAGAVSVGASGSLNLAKPEQPSINLTCATGSTVSFTAPSGLTQTGTISAATNSTTVTGTGTAFTSALLGKRLTTSAGTFIGFVSAVTNSTSLTLSANAANAASNAAFSTSQLMPAATYSNVTINNATTPAIGTGLSANTTINGTLTVTNGVVIIGGNTTGKTTLTLNGAVSGMSATNKCFITHATLSPVSTSYSNLVIGGSGSGTLFFGNTLLNQNNRLDSFTLNRSTGITLGNATSVRGRLILINGQLTGCASFLTLNSSATLERNASSGTLDAAPNTITSLAVILYNPSSNLTTGAELPASSNYTSLTIATTNGATVTLDKAVTIPTVILTSGKLLLGNNNLIANATTGGSASSYIVTNGTGVFRRNSVGFVASPGVLVPIGTTSSYAPVSFVSASVVPGNTLNMDCSVGNVTNTVSNANKIVNLQWSLTPTVTTTSIGYTFQYNPSDFAAGFDVVSSRDLGMYTTSSNPSLSSYTSATLSGGVYTLTTAQNSGFGFTGASTRTFVIGNQYAVNCTAGTYVGANAADANTATNWCNNTLPSGSAAIIAVNRPRLTGNLSVASLNLGSGIDLNGNTLTITGALSGAGTITGGITSSLSVGSGTLNMDLTTPVTSTTLTGRTNVLNNLTVNGGTLTLGNALHLVGTLTKTTGTLATAGNLTLKSTATTQAVVAPITSGSITGNVVVERYIPKGKRAFRDIAPGVTPSTSVFNSWQEGGAFTAGYGTYITGLAATKTFVEAKSAIGFVDGTSGLDLTASGSKSMFTYNNTTGVWDTVTNTKTLTLNGYRGYRVLVRGDRNWSMYLIPQAANMINATTLRSTGTLLTGNQTGFTLNADATGTGSNSKGFSLVGNPYVSPIDWNTIVAANRAINLSSTIWYLNPKTVGYVTYSQATGLTSPSGNNYGRYIQPGQGFFVRTTAASPSLTITEADKEITQTADVFGSEATSAQQVLRVGLYKPVEGITTSMVDETVAVFGKFSNTVNGDDSYKMENSADNIALLNSGNKLAIEARSAVSANDVLPVSLNKLSNGTNYQLKVDASGYNSNGFDVYVKDAYKQTETAVKAGGESVVDFTIDNAVSASFNNRFSLVFKPSVLPISSIDVQGVQQGSDVVLSINTVGESNIGTYSVEKSTDGVGYSVIATVAAKNTATASYGVTDNKAVSGNNYYRVKVNGLNEASTYSKVVVVKVGSGAAKYALYPNPSKGSQVGVQLTGVSAGKYTVTLRNMLGQEVHRAVAAHTGGNGQLSIKLASKLSSGSYTVSVLGATATPLYQGKLVVE